MGPTDALWPALTQRLAELKFEDGWHVETPDGTRLDRSATAQLHKRVCVFRNGDEKAAIPRAPAGRRYSSVPTSASTCCRSRGGACMRSRSIFKFALTAIKLQLCDMYS